MLQTASTTSRTGSRRRALLGLLAAMLMLALAQAAPALAASSPFDGGPLAVDTPTTVADDHTVYAMRFNATTGGTYPLDADTTYYVKLRFTPNADGSPAGVDNRGFTWNDTSGSWVQEREDWTAFPTVTTDSTGAIAQSDWFYCKFGDTTKSGVYYLLVSLSSGIAGNTRNSTVIVPVTVIDMTGAGAWVHAGVDNSATYTFKRTDILDHAAPANPLALQFTEKNLVDDDGNGFVDDEQYGPVQDGGFRMAVPVGQALDVRMQKAVWSVVPSGFTIATPDTDIALGASDQTAPSAPGAVTAKPMNGGATVSWGAATDDTGVTAYDVYRWIDAPAGVGYTPLPVKVATVTSGTSYADSGLVNGTTYHYLVRAVDAATNVGPRSAQDAVTPAKPRVKLGRPVAPKTVKVRRKFTAYGTLAPRHSSGTKYVKIKCYQKRSGKWRLRMTVGATTLRYKSYSRYSARFSLKARGNWKLVASYRETADYASTTSRARYVRVR